jgi:hypothetical protein
LATSSLSLKVCFFSSAAVVCDRFCLNFSPVFKQQRFKGLAVNQKSLGSNTVFGAKPFLSERLVLMVNWAGVNMLAKWPILAKPLSLTNARTVPSQAELACGQTFALAFSTSPSLRTFG